jgi:hypothetical protein
MHTRRNLLKELLFACVQFSLSLNTDSECSYTAHCYCTLLNASAYQLCYQPIVYTTKTVQGAAAQPNGDDT